MNKILVIEDDLTVREGIVDLLTEEGFDVYQAENGRHGVETAKKILPDLIISDILMPELDGYAVFDELQKNTLTANIPFMFLSARTSNDDIRTGMNLGVDDYLTKPYKADDLINAVSARLSRKRFFDRKLEELQTSIAKSLPHELRTPLVSVIGFSQLILDNSDKLEYNELLDMVRRISSAGSNLLKLIQKFILFSELEIHTNDKEYINHFRTETSIPAKELFFTNTMYTADEYNRKHDLKLNLKEAELRMNFEHLKFIINQLVENSCKFSEKNSSISISTEVLDKDYIIVVSDNGVGMTEEQLNEIGILKQFDRETYFQDGVGLGLAITKKLVQLYNGEFNISSSKDCGTTVRITLKQIID